MHEFAEKDELLTAMSVIVEADISNRNREQGFFASPVWVNVADENKGSTALRSRVSGILEYRMRRALPDLSADVERRIVSYRQELRNLGEKMPADETRRRLLLQKFANLFRDISLNAVHGSYSEPFFSPTGCGAQTKRVNRLLCLRISNLGDAFRNAMADRGASFVIEQQDVRRRFGAHSDQNGGGTGSRGWLNFRKTSRNL